MSTTGVQYLIVCIKKRTTHHYSALYEFLGNVKIVVISKRSNIHIKYPAHSTLWVKAGSSDCFKSSAQCLCSRGTTKNQNEDVNKY